MYQLSKNIYLTIILSRVLFLIMGPHWRLLGAGVHLLEHLLAVQPTPVGTKNIVAAANRAAI